MPKPTIRPRSIVVRCMVAVAFLLGLGACHEPGHGPQTTTGGSPTHQDSGDDGY